MSEFESAVRTLREGLRDWNKGAVPGLMSSAAVQFDAVAARGDRRAQVGAAVARGFAGDLDTARRRLYEVTAQHPDYAAGYIALAVFALRDADPLAHAESAAWALVAARDLAPDVGCIERMLAQALASAGEFMGALQCARAAMTLDRDDGEARMWSALLRLYFGGDGSAGSVLEDVARDAELCQRSSAPWLGAVAALYARGEFHEARVALRRAIAPLKIGDPEVKPLVDKARRWYRELRGFGPGLPMTGERWLRDVGGASSDYVRTRAAMTALREAMLRNPERAQHEGVDPLDVDRALGELEARTRRGMLEWGARLIIRGFAEAYLPLVACLEPPPVEVLSAMDLIVLDG